MNVQPDSTLVAMLVELACRAPSVHNSQPWTWRYTDGRLDLFSDRSRILAAADPDGRALVISCGAALAHLQTAAQAWRWSTDVEVFPSPAAPQHLARVHFVHGARPRSHEFDLLTAINRRRSDRRPFGGVRTELAMTPEMARAGEENGTEITVLSDRARQALAEASHLSASARKYDSTYQAELRWWAGHTFGSDGIPPGSLADSTESREVDVGRRFPEPSGRDHDTRVKEDAATVLVLATAHDRPDDWLRSGRTLSSVLLEATAEGLATCPLTHVTEQPGSRAVVASLVPAGAPQVLVRIGTPASGPGPDQTPRQRVSSILTFDGVRSRARS
ncbi:Acg family FMN-binding oxidoreductase [Rhodococcoides yunnanense]|uniref:Acg family FMN-binding oxidoreductase n=1 Tax=Rhodococcoides yunnanense TaxID=278209 RepID=UPI000A9BD94D|nr:hypothetical protein [Rhodococcus yunnanensis]